MPDEAAGPRDGGPMAVPDERLQGAASDLHDGLLQYVIGARMVNEAIRRKVEAGTLPGVSEVDTVEQYLQHAIAEGRRLIKWLRFARRDELDLVESLRGLAQDLMSAGRIRCDVHVEGRNAPSSEVAESLYRIAQEAISNIRRHSGARAASVRLQQRPDEVVLEISDDGQGFDAAAVAGNEHFGLVGMRERTEAMGGHLTIESAVDQGTRLTIRLPSEVPEVGVAEGAT
jgi:signal transduction histidine kinase